MPEKDSFAISDAHGQLCVTGHMVILSNGRVHGWSPQN